MRPSYERREALLRVIRLTALIEFPELRKIRNGSNCEELGFEDLTFREMAAKIKEFENQDKMKGVHNAKNR
jgi:hypothetical protein